MEITGIICEYNPLHLGHKKQLDLLKAENDTGIVCLMSGNFVQRGEPAIMDKSLRAKSAVLSGADLVLEMPVTASLSSAEGFAGKSVEILGKFCSRLSFGAETPDKALLLAAAETLNHPDFPEKLKEALSSGISFPAARQRALEALGVDGSILQSPNNILAVEYCKAICRQGCAMEPAPIFRDGDYHAELPHPENPSASSLRQMLLAGQDASSYFPTEAWDLFRGASLHRLENGERAILSKLRTMTEEEFSLVPYGSEGLWRKLMHAARSCATLPELIAAVKSKRYTYTRISRMVMCAFLGITEQMLKAAVPYIRVLAFNEKGRQILKQARATGTFLNAGEKADDPWQEVENRCGDLYGLFSQIPEAPGAESRRRVISL